MGTISMLETMCVYINFDNRLCSKRIITLDEGQTELSEEVTVYDPLVRKIIGLYLQADACLLLLTNDNLILFDPNNTNGDLYEINTICSLTNVKDCYVFEDFLTCVLLHSGRIIMFYTVDDIFQLTDSDLINNLNYSFDMHANGCNTLKLYKFDGSCTILEELRGVIRKYNIPAVQRLELLDLI